MLKLLEHTIGQLRILCILAIHPVAPFANYRWNLEDQHGGPRNVRDADEDVGMKRTTGNNPSPTETSTQVQNNVFLTSTKAAAPTGTSPHSARASVSVNHSLPSSS